MKFKPTRDQLTSKCKPLTQSLFLELGYTKFALYTLKDDDHVYKGKTYLSIKDLQLPILAAELRQLATLDGGQAIGPPARITIGLGHPVADRLGRWFKLARQLLRRTSSPDQRDQLLAKLRRIRLPGFGHRGLLLPQGLGVHESGSGPLRLDQRQGRPLIQLVQLHPPHVQVARRGLQAVWPS